MKVPKAPKVKRAKSTSTVGHYVTNGVLLPAVIEAKELGKVTTKLIKMIQMIAERYSRKSNFIGYSFREDMVSAAVMNLCNNALKFKPEKSSNPFSFYTTAIHNSFLQYMADEKKHRNIRDALLIDAGSNPSFNFLECEKDESHFEIKESDEVIPPPEVKGIDQEDLPVAIRNVEVEPTAKVRHAKWIARDPGPCITYGPDDIIIDPVTGAISIKPQPEVPVKKPRKKPVAKLLQAPVEEVKALIVKKTRAKRVEIAKEYLEKTCPAFEEAIAKAKKTAKEPTGVLAGPVKKIRVKKAVVEPKKPAPKKPTKVAPAKPAPKKVVKAVPKKVTPKKTTIKAK